MSVGRHACPERIHKISLCPCNKFAALCKIGCDYVFSWIREFIPIHGLSMTNTTVMCIDKIGTILGSDAWRWGSHMGFMTHHFGRKGWKHADCKQDLCQRRELLSMCNMIDRRHRFDISDNSRQILIT